MKSGKVALMLKNHFALTNGRITLPNQLLNKHTLVIKNGLIDAIIPDDNLATLSIPQIDVHNRLITPGLIDIHIHGALGASFNRPTPESYATITAENARRGITSLLATTATDTIENLVKCLEFVGWWMDRRHGKIMWIFSPCFLGKIIPLSSVTMNFMPIRTSSGPQRKPMTGCWCLKKKV